MLGAVFMQLVVIRWVLAIVISLGVGLALRNSEAGLGFTRYKPDPGMARSSDEWRDASKRKKDGKAKSADAIEAAVEDCMDAWEKTPIDLRGEMGKPASNEAEAREKMRPVAEARCRRSARYRN